MNIKELNSRQNNFTDKNLITVYSQFGNLLDELKKRELSENVEKLVNDCIDQINSSILTGKQLANL